MIRKTAFAFLSITIIITLWRMYYIDYISSIIPGWNTTINPLPVSLLFYIWIAFCVVIYFRIFKRRITLNKKLFILHILFTSPLLISEVLLFIVQSYNDFIVISSLMKFRFFSLLLYFIGQITFLLQLINIYKKKGNPN
ncbi:MAG: hypothetical protein DI539_00975 [Flavobacterium psychrophilum]|nr:MAG: hypothetical protein DI539_00975 [Flavobacterium psychrophilum]